MTTVKLAKKLSMWSWLCAAILLSSCLFFALVVSGCGIAPREDGNGYVLGVTMTGDGSAEQVGQMAGGLIQTLTGLPIGDAVAGLVSTGLGVLGIGGWAAARSGRKAERQGWDEAKIDAATQQARLEAEWYAAKFEAERGQPIRAVHGQPPADPKAATVGT